MNNSFQRASVISFLVAHKNSSFTRRMINRDEEIEKKSFEMSASDLMEREEKKMCARRKINREIFTNNKSEKYV